MPDEWAPAIPAGNVRDRWRQHPCRLIGPAVPALLAGAGWLFFALGSGSPVIEAVLGVLSVALALRLTWHVLEWLTDWVVVTDEQITRASGPVLRQTTTLMLASVTRVDNHHSLLGRALGYGELVLTYPGASGGGMHLELVPRPDQRYELLRGLLTKTRSARPF